MWLKPLDYATYLLVYRHPALVAADLPDVLGWPWRLCGTATADHDAVWFQADQPRQFASGDRGAEHREVDVLFDPHKLESAKRVPAI